MSRIGSLEWIMNNVQENVFQTLNTLLALHYVLTTSPRRVADVHSVTNTLTYWPF